MAILHLAATAPINPPGATPVLNKAQVWAGLQRKVRFAHEFVPPITSCIVEKEEGNVVTRRVVFEGVRELSETCTEYAPCRVDFRLEDGSEVANIVGDGPSGDEHDLHLTYAFKWVMPDIAEGSEEAKQTLAKQQEMARGAISSSLATIRKMYAEGKL